jgi:hypothetical protein
MWIACEIIHDLQKHVHDWYAARNARNEYEVAWIVRDDIGSAMLRVHPPRLAPASASPLASAPTRE